jgi:ATP-binding cassette subfamily B multidrug efflux pump
MVSSLAEVTDDYATIKQNVHTIYQPFTVVDAKAARPLRATAGKIDIQLVDFRYPEASRYTFKGLKLHIKPGQKVGLVGHSGAGKSTLMSLLLRFYDVQKGRIEIDGQNIAKVTQQSLRRQMVMVPQDTALFNRSILENIRYGRPEATEAEVIEAAKKAHAHAFIEKLPKGYDSKVGERGVKLSGGQRQRIAIARAFLSAPKIVLLDEATSALDSESEVAIQKSLTSLMKGRTVIAIAHRLSTLRQMDRIVVMDEGKIVEDGTHAQLLKKKGSIYARLWQLQKDGFIPEGP